MYSGGPPVFLMWSGMFNPDKNRARKPADWKRIRALFAPYRREETIILCAIALNALLGLAPPILIVFIIDRAIPHKNLGELFAYTAAAVVCALLTGLVGVYQGYQNHRMGKGIMRDLRSQLVSHLHKLPVDFFSSTKSGEVVNRVSNDVDSVDDLVSGTLVTIVSNIVVMASTVIAMLIMDWRLTLLSLFLLPVMIGPLWPIGRKMYTARKASREKRDQIASIIQETLSLSGITLLKVFGAEAREREKFKAVANSLMNVEIDLAMTGRWFFMVIMIMVIIGPALLWLAGGYLVIKGELGLGEVTAFVTLLNRLYTPVTALTGVQVQIAGALAVFERIFEYLDMKEEGGKSSATLAGASVRGELEFCHVSFQYREDKPALKDVSFTIAPGEMVALVGSSGAGKSTIASLIPRFYEPTEGSILLDGQDIAQVKLDDLRAQIGLVTQETYLFHDTIEENLRYAKPDASPEELNQALVAANIADLIKSLPEGLATTVGERGHKLSGGERQRLAIARVVLKNPRILILDEATSSLDSVNEAAIQEALSSLMKGRTSLVIAHRLSTIAAADKILVLDAGAIVEVGKHDELLSAGGKYAQLHRQIKQENSAGQDDQLPD